VLAFCGRRARCDTAPLAEKNSPAILFHAQVRDERTLHRLRRHATDLVELGMGITKAARTTGSTLARVHALFHPFFVLTA
jgi:hypothetical protein